MSIFNSRFSLKYEDRVIENQYTEMRHQYLRCTNITFAVISLLFSLVNTVLFVMTEVDDLAIVLSKYITYIVAVVHVILLILSTTCSHTKVQIVVSYLNFFFVLFPFSCFRNYLTLIPGVDMIYIVLIYTSQILFRQLWFFSNNIDFMEGCVLVVVMICVVYITFGIVTPVKIHHRFSIQVIMILISMGITYCYVLEKKKSFYYNYKLKEKNYWYDSIIQNMDSGYMKVVSDKICFVNKTLLNNLCLNSNFLTCIWEGSNATAEEAVLNLSEKASSDLLSVVFESMVFHDGGGGGGSLLDRCGFIKDRNENKFIPIGALNLKLDKAEGVIIHYEVFCRYTANKSDERMVEFMFKNISQVMLQGQLNDEFKYKTLFLSKIAHEFKNPLLCITELVEEVTEISKAGQISSSTTIQEKLTNIKSMSDYLIILIKDMDFFSQKTNNKQLSLVKERVVVADILTFCRHITETLIKKLNKNITIQIEKDSCVRDIYTDQTKLKQILVNLLSNAVKFTNSGVIKLIFRSIDGKDIELVVEDTGRGMTTEQKSKLFTPFTEDVDRSSNPLGTGLGLYIVKELVGLIESELKYASEQGKGTLFSFKIPIADEVVISPALAEHDDKILNQSDSTVLYDYYPIFQHEIADCSPEVKGSEIDGDTLVMILVDDDPIVRKSTLRLIKGYYSKQDIKCKVLEANDGIECLYIYYQLSKMDTHITCIISDESMEYVNGSKCADMLSQFYKEKGLQKVPFYLLTAYENFKVENMDAFFGVFTKPFMNSHLQVINKEIL
jgi:signal transduction histidine kinase